MPSDRSSLVLIYSLASAIDFLAFLIIWARRWQAAAARPLGWMVLAAAFSALRVRRKLDRLDLVEVLKSRE